MVRIKLPGSTLIEVIVAMVIITIILAIGFLIFSNIISGVSPYTKLKAEAELDAISKNINSDQIPENKTIKTEKFIIIQTVEIPTEFNGTYMLRLQIKDLNEKSIALRKEIKIILN